MKLGSLVYEVVKDAIEFPSGFNKEGFIRGDYDEDRDFNSQISFAFNYINLAFSRLLTSKKTLLKVVKKISDEAGYIEFKEGEVISVVSGLGRDYERVNFATYGEGIAVEKEYVQKVIYVEYRPYIPHFNLESIRDQALDEDNEEIIVEVEIDLEQYGLTDEMCSYVKEYAKGGLTEYLSPELSQKHIQMAENYFTQLKTRYTDYPQRKIENRFDDGGVF